MRNSLKLLIGFSYIVEKLCNNVILNVLQLSIDVIIHISVGYELINHIHQPWLHAYELYILYVLVLWGPCVLMCLNVLTYAHLSYMCHIHIHILYASQLCHTYRSYSDVNVYFMQEGWLLIKNRVPAVILVEKEIETGTRTLNGVAQN